MADIIKNVPIPTAGVALGLVALGNLLASYSALLQGMAVVLSLVMAALVIAKAVLFPAVVAEDLRNPIFASVSATLFMALMQVAAFFSPVAMMPALVLWVSAVVGHLTLMGWFSFAHLRRFSLERVFPTYFICYVGIIVASVTSAPFGLEMLGTVLFWVGFACYPMLLILVTLRYAKHEMPAPARPLFCIYSAPSSLSIAGYLAVTEEPNIAFVAVLLVCAQAFFVLVLTQVPRFIKGGFFPSYAAMTFPFVITATALSAAVGLFQENGFAWAASLEPLVLAETAFATFMVLFVFIRYAIFLLAPLREKVAARRAMGEGVSQPLMGEAGIDLS